MKDDDFKFYQDFLKKRTGLHLTAEKTYLLATRLSPLGKTLGFETLDDYTAHLRSGRDPAALDMVAEAMMTHETSFFRDTKPFHHLKSTVLPALMERRAQARKIRLYSAACSTGQEAYSIAITLRDLGDKIAGWHIDILGTDIADNVLKKAAAGEYNNFEIQRGLSMPAIVRHFRQDGQNWHVKDELKSMVRFRKFNLLDSLRPLGQFDIIFCRNVLIYFNAETKLQVLRGLHQILADDGVLFLGSCENVMSDQSEFIPVGAMHGAYTKKTGASLFSESFAPGLRAASQS